MEHRITGRLERFNQLWKQMDEIYHQYAKKHRISDMTLWLLYSLYQNSAAFTQRELCAEWHYPPQTVNSALKNLERQGYVRLESGSGNRKNKLVVLTEEGKELTQAMIAPLVQAEQNAFGGMEETEAETLLSLIEAYVELLQSTVD